MFRLNWFPPFRRSPKYEGNTKGLTSEETCQEYFGVHISMEPRFVTPIIGFAPIKATFDVSVISA